MNINWQKFLLIGVLISSAIAAGTRPAPADSTADLIMNLKCEDATTAEVWKNRKTGGLFFRAETPSGKLTSYLGKTQKTEGVKVYKFQDSSREYWVWDGNLDNPQAAPLEIYNNGRLVKRHSCQKL